MMAAEIKAIIGLGNPGLRFYNTRHNVGFRVVDQLAEQHNAHWQVVKNMELAELFYNGNKLFLVKPQTYMNSSGLVIPYLQKKGIKAENLLVVHDELELPFGQVKLREGGSARGHNGLKSIIELIGENFLRLRCGIGRPAEREQVADYVLAPFPPAYATATSGKQDVNVQAMLDLAVAEIEKLLAAE